MTKYLFTCLLLLSTIIISSDLLADYAVQGIEVTCNKTIFEIAAYNLINEEPSSNVIKLEDGKTHYFGNKEHSVICKIDKYKIEGTFETSTPQPRGLCGGAPGTRVSLSINGLESINALFNNSCYEAVKSIKLEDNKYIGFVFKICGHTNTQVSPIVDGCFEFRHQFFSYLPLPISGPPITAFIGGSMLDKPE